MSSELETEFKPAGEELSAGFRMSVEELEQTDRRIAELEQQDEQVAEYASLIRSRNEEIQQIKNMAKVYVRRDVLLCGYLITHSTQERSSINRKKLSELLSSDQLVSVTDFKTISVVKIQQVPGSGV